jgi:hypothetical protein
MLTYAIYKMKMKYIFFSEGTLCYSPIGNETIIYFILYYLKKLKCHCKLINVHH